MIDLNEFNYTLPDERIALYPLVERDQSKLLVYQNEIIEHAKFDQLAKFIPAHSILFFNDTKVISARLHFQKETGAGIEIFLLNPLSSSILSIAMNAKEKSQWHCAIGNLKRWKQHSTLKIKTEEFVVEATLLDKENSVVELRWSPMQLTFAEVIQKIGVIPLPPYIHRIVERADDNRYQTVYSKNNGAVAAPTAGLHFTDAVFASLKEKKIATDFLTLHVSAGTFMPIKVSDATQHVMHAEQIIISKKNIENLLVADRQVVAVGTTSLRTLESLYWYGVKLISNPDVAFTIDQHEVYHLHPASKHDALNALIKKMDSEKTDHLIGESSIFIFPPYSFKMVDALITNFHQPHSTLILLVAAWAGKDWRKIYESALANEYRFLSYGDSSLLFKKKQIVTTR